MSAAPLQFLLMVFAGWVNRRQVDMIEYLKEENRVLREQMGGGRLRLTDDQRRRLAVKGRAVGHRERHHQGLDHQLITPPPVAATRANDSSPVVRLERLGGLLNSYHRRAA